MFNRGARAAARLTADDAARAEAAAIAASDQAKHAAYQAELDEYWSRLQANDSDVVLTALAEAFEDNEAAAAPVGVTGAEAAVVVLVPPTTSVPDRKPAMTPAGNLSLKKLTKHESADFYKLLVYGFVIATVKEAFAEGPGLDHVRVVAIRRGRTDAYGKRQTEALLGARFSRSALEGIQWATADAADVVNDASDDLVVRFLGASKELTPLDLAAEPDIAALLAVVDLEELGA
jgi:hypothetical protein